MKKLFDKVEMELIKADITMLKHENEQNGNMEKWRKSQFMWGDYAYKSNREVIKARYGKEYAERIIGVEPIKIKKPRIRKRK